MSATISSTPGGGLVKIDVISSKPKELTISDGITDDDDDDDDDGDGDGDGNYDGE